ncbi:heavy metal translocating P-type ATPase [Oleidesulfovibrio alaskensis]
MKNRVRIKHSVAGRVRFYVQALRRNDILADSVCSAMLQYDGIEHVRANTACSSLVVFFVPAQMSVHDVTAGLEAVMAQNHPARQPVCEPACASGLCGGVACRTTRTGCDPVRPAARKFAVLSALMGGVFVRRTVLGLPLAVTAFSPLGLVTVAACVPLFRQAYRQIRQRRFTLEAFLGASCVAAVAAGEAVTAMEVLWINSGADLLKAWITERSRKSISDILTVTTHHTFVLVDGVEVEADVASLRCGDVVVFHTGEKICVDGEIVDGEALIDESPITGRPDFVPRTVGDEVLAGVFVRQGVIYVRARCVGDRTYLARMLRRVEDALEHRAPIEGAADRLAARLVKLGFAATAATFVFTGSAWRAFTVMLVMACPCATVLAASTAVSAAMSAAARRNILIKGGRYLEEAGKADVVCFDKTGTLTGTAPVLADMVVFASENTAGAAGQPEDLLLRLSMSVEMHNHHPLAQAIKAEAERRGLQPEPHAVCEYFLGKGMRAEIGGDEVLVGNRKLLEQFGVATGKVSRRASVLRKKGLTVLYVVRGGEILGLLGFDNQLRPESRAVVQRLKACGVRRVVLVTGDEENTAAELASRLDIEEVHASVMPEEKALIVEKLQAQGASVLMVGDGINDALALTGADVGIAMGAMGSEVAIEAADIALVTDDLQGITYVYSLSTATMRVIRQNFWIATGSNLLGAALGAAGILSPVMAGVLHIVHTLGVLGNSSRLLRHEPPALADLPGSAAEAASAGDR